MRRIDYLGRIAVGGAAGALVRWGIAEAWGSSEFPWPTLLVNVLGCGLLALVTADSVPLHQQRLLAVGFCGGLTTFSTLTVEVVRLNDAGDISAAALYVVLSVVLGLAAFVAARALRSSTPVEAST